MRPSHSSRPAWTLAAAALLVGALAFATGYTEAPRFIRGHVGDLAAAAFGYAVIWLVRPQWRVALRASVAFAVAMAIEASQALYGADAGGGLSRELLLGRTADPLDLVMYALGVVAAVGFEHRAR